MKRRRPTLPLSEWRIALNLNESNKVQNQEGTPAYNCSCESCEYWRLMYERILPEESLLELTRLGINLNTPADVYEHGSDETGRHFRIIFHVVGKILGGPEYYVHNEKIDHSVLNYRVTRQEPYFSIVVLPHLESYDSAPEYKKSAGGELITIDMRLTIP